MNPTQILKNLPYSEPFLFVDEIVEVSENGIKGNHTFRKDAFFYRGHFKDNPITPGVILTECMAQIGVVCLGIYLLGNVAPALRPRSGQVASATKASSASATKIALSSTEVEFYLPVFPGEKVNVVSEKTYFRFNKLKCRVKMYNETGKLVCKGEISGMLVG